MKQQIIFVTGIDTGVGKSYVTGLLARYLLEAGSSVITQKIVQTGCAGISEDIALHRRLMGVPCGAEDQAGLTCPYCFEVPASPHLAARLAGVEVDPARIDEATRKLAGQYDYVVMEGVGGLCVPLADRYTILDFVVERSYAVVLVTSPRLGSINHTLMSLELLSQRGAKVIGLAYNVRGIGRRDVAADSRRLFEQRLEGLGYPASIVDIPVVNMDDVKTVDFSIIM